MTRAAVQGMNGFGITHNYTLKIRNVSSQSKRFSYVIQGQKCSVDYMIDSSKNGIIKPEAPIVKDVPAWVWLSTEYFNYDISPGETVTINIKNTLLTGSNPTLHNAFVIDGEFVYDTKEHIDQMGNTHEYMDNFYENLLDKVRR